MLSNRPKENYKVGEIYEFTVNGIHDDFCELIDSAGFHVYLKHTRGLSLSKGQKVLCRVTANYQKRPKIELVDDKSLNNRQSRITSETVNKIINSSPREWNTDGFADLLLMNEVEDRTFDNECRQWIETLRNDNNDLQKVSADCEEFMEESDFLSLCTPAEREHYQQRLTEIIDKLGFYITADKLLADGKAAEFTERLLDKLEKTGYVYHPEENFHVLSILFLFDRSLMEDSIPRLFDIIRKWPVEIWDKEPFKGALIKSLNLYVDENIWNIDRRDDNGHLVRNLGQALSILYIIADNKDNLNAQLPDERLVLARMSVISTYIGEYSNRELLSLATSSLLSDNYYRPKFLLADTNEQKIPTMLKAHSVSLPAWPVNTSNCFIGGRLRLVVSKDGMAVWTDNPKAKAVVPEQLHLWGNMQVYADRSTMPQLSGDITVNDSKRLWTAIERDLFLPGPESGKTKEKSASKVEVDDVHGVGDTVYITITRVDEEDENDKGDNRAYCTIEGETEESGYIYGRDIASYMHHLSLWMFQDRDGRPLTLEATISSEDEDGMFHFDMIELIKEYVCSKFVPGDSIICSMGAARRATTDSYLSPAITIDGYSISLGGSIGEDLQRGDLVEATYMGKASGTFHLYCTVKGRFDGFKVDMARAFHNLMLSCAFVDDTAQQPAETEVPKAEISNVDLENADRMLDVAYVKELIRIIDRMAVIDKNYVSSYNYIAFARVLCKMIGWNSRADYYRGRLQLIDMLYEFAKNDTVDESQLTKLQNEDSELFINDTQLREKYQQLYIISLMGSQTHDDALMKFRATTQGLTRQISSLAMAYNILKENNMQQQANDVLNNMKSMLHLNGYESHLKTYGNGLESRTVEFKTSIVYPPANDSMPDIKRQTHTILTVIASFLNTDGGTLYIGVNDSGAGVGVYDDLCYQEFNGDKDKYQRYVLDAVALEWGNSVASYVSADWDRDDKTGKDVLIISVEPYARGVELDGEWFYRNGSGNRHLSKAEFAEYNGMRLSRLSARIAAVPAEKPEAESSATDSTATGSGNASVSAGPSAAEPSVHIATSGRRKNVLQEYENERDFVPYVACLKFMQNGKLQKTTDYDYDTTTELTLPVYEDDVKDGFLILGYEDGTVAKVPVREIMKFYDYKDYSRYTGSRLLFAAIGFDNEGIISVTEENKSGHRVMVRVDHISGIEKSRLTDSGERVYNEGIASKALRYEIAPAEALDDVRNILDRDARTLGFPLSTLSPDIKSELAKCGVAEV